MKKSTVDALGATPLPPRIRGSWLLYSVHLAALVFSGVRLLGCAGGLCL